MRTLLRIVTFTTILLFNNVLFSQNLFTDDFDYPPTDDINGIDGWFSNQGPYPIKVVSPGLTYSSYAGSGIGNCVEFSNYKDGDIVNNSFPSQTSGSIYLTFLISVQSLTDSAIAGYNIALDEAGGSTNINTKLYVKRLTANTFNFGMEKLYGGEIAYSDSVYNTNTTYLAVVVYKFVNGDDNDTVKGYIFSSGVPSEEPQTTDLINSDGVDAADIGEVVLNNSWAQDGLKNSIVRVDGIRIGLSWESSILSSVELISSKIPESFDLGQNYPNPFNPGTNINFQLPVASHVELKVYDILGNDVVTLINENKEPGNYKVMFDATTLASGTYIYRLSAVDAESSLPAGKARSGQVFISIKKMLLIK
jgi:hypothetical protein